MKVLFTSLIMCLFAASAQAKYGGGTGEPNDPYQIATAADLLLLGDSPADYNKHFILTADVDLDPNLPGRRVFDMAVIAPDTDPANSEYQGVPFTGVFDGKGHTISHLTIQGGSDVGLFGRIEPGATVLNLGVEGVEIETSWYDAGGLAGSNGGSITASYSTGVVQGSVGIGGLVGHNWGHVTASYSHAAVRGSYCVGGIVGSNGGSIAMSYSTGTAIGTDTPTTGFTDGGAVGSCFWDVEASGQLQSWRAVGLTTAEMQDINTFLNAGWDFVGETRNGTCDYWEMTPGEYPRLHYRGGRRPVMPDGSGTAEQPYLIRDITDLGTVWSEPLAHYRLEAPLDLSGITWCAAVIPSFDGTFDGNGCAVRNLHIESGGSLGLFGELGPAVLVANVGLEDADVNGTGEQVGALAGSNLGAITGCYSTGAVTASSGAGGLTGSNDGTIIASYSTAAVDGYWGWAGGLAAYNRGSITGSHASGPVGSYGRAGGLVGENNGRIAESYSDGYVIVSYRASWEIYGGEAGGLVGANGAEIISSYSVSRVAGDCYVGGLAGTNDGTIKASHSGGAVNGRDWVGGFAGENRGSITDSYSTGATTARDYVGGLVGRNYEGYIAVSYSAGAVTARDYVGGLVGDNDEGYIRTSHSTCRVTGNYDVGGLVGQNCDNIVGSYSTGWVTGNSDVGGLVGWNRGGIISTSYCVGAVSGDMGVGGLAGHNGGNITASYSTGPVTGNYSAGGFVGSNGGTVFSGFWNRETSGQSEDAAATGLTTAEMRDISTFLDAGWDFVAETRNGTCDYWEISPGEYPRLRYHIDSSPVMPEGLGTAEQPYLIRDARDWGTIWSEPRAHYRLEASLDLSGTVWSMAVVPWFDGTFDGNGCVISNLRIRGGGLLGLFGRAATISDLGLEAVDVEGTGAQVGSLAGEAWGTITDCHSTGTVAGDAEVGGLVGCNCGDIHASYNTAAVKGKVCVGGLAGRSLFRIDTSYSTGTVKGGKGTGGLVGWNGGDITASYGAGVVSGDSQVGGLVGCNSQTITATRSTGDVTGNEEIGGLVGRNERSISNSYSTSAVSGNVSIGGLAGGNYRGGSIATSYSVGSVSGDSGVGGLVGSNGTLQKAAVGQCFWDVETSARPASDGGTGKTTSQMQTASTYTDAGWDFMGEMTNGTEDIWWIDEGKDYPRLWWELPTGN